MRSSFRQWFAERAELVVLGVTLLATSSLVFWWTILLRGEMRTNEALERALLDAQTGLMDDPDYGVLLTAFGPNLMHGTGSRALRREGGKAGDKPPEARQMRAIPHNAILGQMGHLANTVSGLGAAVKTNMEFYERMMRTSPRFRTIMDLARRGIVRARKLHHCARP